MTAPVIFFMFLNVFAPIVINDNYLTTIIFDESIIKSHSGASENELYLKKSPNSKILFIKSKGREVKTNLNILTKSGKLYSFLIRTGKKPHSIIQVKDGKKDNIFKDVRNIQGVVISEGSNVLRVTNNRKISVDINSIILSPGAKYEFCSGAPLFIGAERVYR